MKKFKVMHTICFVSDVEISDQDYIEMEKKDLDYIDFLMEKTSFRSANRHFEKEIQVFDANDKEIYSQES